MLGRPNNETVTDEELSAFADGQLSRARSASVAAYLRTDPGAAERVFSYWMREAELYRSLGVSPGEEGDPAPGRSPRGRGPVFAGIAALLLAGVLLLPWLWNREQGETLYPPETYVETGAAPAKTAPTFAGLELPATKGQHPVAAGMREFHFTAADGSSLAFYSVSMDSAGLGALPKGDAALVEWVGDGRHYALAGNLAGADMIATAVLLQRKLSAAAGAGVTRIVESPVMGEQKPPPLPEESVQGGVSTM